MKFALATVAALAYSVGQASAQVGILDAIVADGDYALLAGFVTSTPGVLEALPEDISK